MPLQQFENEYSHIVQNIHVYEFVLFVSSYVSYEL